MTEISDGTTTLAPLLWMRYATTRDAGATAHRLMSGRTALTLAPASARRCTVVLLFADETQSEQCEQMHSRTGVLTITEADRPTLDMSYVVVGRVTRELDPETAEVWIVSAEVIEVGE